MTRHPVGDIGVAELLGAFGYIFFGGLFKLNFFPKSRENNEWGLIPTRKKGAISSLIISIRLLNVFLHQ